MRMFVLHVMQSPLDATSDGRQFNERLAQANDSSVIMNSKKLANKSFYGTLESYRVECWQILISI